jgi:hypothetical protein
LLQGAPPLKDLLDPDVELVEPDEAELLARQPVVLDLVGAGGRGSSAKKAAARPAAPPPSAKNGSDTEEEEQEEEIVDLT